MKKQLMRRWLTFNRMKKVRQFFIVFLTFTFLSCLIYLISYHVDAYSNEQEMKQLSPVIPSFAETVSSSEKNIGDKVESAPNRFHVLPQFQEQYEKNPDIFGWISIDGTNVNYPVMFTPRDGEYYLHRNFDKKFESRGLPFLDENTDLQKSSNYLIYGHSMKDGTAFADLLYYESESFFEKHPVIHFNTIYQTGDYKIIGVLRSRVFNQNENVFKYYQFNYPATDDQYKNFIANVKKNSLYDTGESAFPGEQLVTLSTCSYHTKDGRLAVVAKKIT